jgi:pyridoxamine 5'-phosphate oxidase
MSDVNPIDLFAEWFEKASRAGVDKPHAMVLGTVGADARPSSRVVLLSSYDERGFVFHTNYESAKGTDIARNPWVALVFWWDSLGYQVRIEGRAERTSAADSDSYFAKRPRGSQLSAWASEQSRSIESREWIEERMRTLDGKYRNQTVARPPHWGGYRVVPQVIEFWQHRENRLHERMRFDRDQSGEWRGVRLAP